MEGVENIAVENVAVPEATAEQMSFQANMDYAFNTDTPPAPIVQEENVGVGIPASPEGEKQAVTVDYSSFVKENFGVDTIEEAKTQWQALQDLKANPPKANEFTFENEESKKLHELVRTGKLKEAWEIIGQQQKIEELTSSEVTDVTADEIIKLGMKFENKELTQKEIDFKFRKQFTLPKEPVQALGEDNDDFDARIGEWRETVEDIKMSKTIEAKMMKPKLEAAKAKIQFPDILQSNVDPDYEAYKARNAEVSERVDTQIAPAIKSLKNTDVQLGFKVSDPNNQMEFDVSLAATPEAFEKARQNSLSFDSWFHNVCYDETGKFRPENVQKLILLYDEHGNYDQSIARQAVNAERSRVIAKETGFNASGGKEFNVNLEKSEFQKQMDYRLS